MSAAMVGIGLTGVNLLLVFQPVGHIPGNLDQGRRLDESSFWIALSSSEPDSAWTNAIREKTSQDTFVIAPKPGVQLSALVGRSMYVPSELHGGHVPGYNLNQRFYLLEQRGYSPGMYDARVRVVDTIYTSADAAAITGALHELKELHRPVTLYFPDQETPSLRWLDNHVIGRELFFDGQNTVWLVEDPNTLP